MSESFDFDDILDSALDELDEDLDEDEGYKNSIKLEQEVKNKLKCQSESKTTDIENRIKNNSFHETSVENATRERLSINKDIHQIDNKSNKSFITEETREEKELRETIESTLRLLTFDKKKKKKKNFHCKRIR